MFKKVLVAEDIDSVNEAVRHCLSSLGVPEVAYVQYCDEAFLKVRRAALEEEPFDLLICDLSFKTDHRHQKLNSGEELMAVLKKDFPSLKIIAHSIEDHPQKVRMLWDSNLIDAYVCKDRQGLQELKKAVEAVARGNNYNSPQIELALKQENLYMLPEYEIKLLNYLSAGFTQAEIQERFKTEGISPNSKSSIEKRLKEIREEFGANTNPHLISILKDLRLL